MTPARADHVAAMLYEWARMSIWIERLDSVGTLCGDAMLVEENGDHQYERVFEWVGSTRRQAAACFKDMWRGRLVETSTELRIYLESHCALTPEHFGEALREVRFAMESGAAFDEPAENERAIFGAQGEGAI